MLLNRNVDKETINILLQENKRLKRENQRLHESLDELQQYKDEYRSLIDVLKQAKGMYADRLKGFDKLEKEYRKELDRIAGKKKKKDKK